MTQETKPEERKGQLITADLAYDELEVIAKSELSPLLDAGRTEYQEQWALIQPNWSINPRQCVAEADALVAGVIQQLATKFDEQRTSLEQQWESGGEASTEDLRQALQHYRSFFQRLLAT